MLFTQTDVAVVRHVVQRILVPCVFVIGLLGNSVSIYVLTRKRMRCTTNIYLTALAITDIIYLTMALLLSLKHYDYVQRHCEPYWMFYGMLVWLCDACAYISIYIAVCFTIERFIAIRYPLKRQTFCTESLAKKVIAGVALFCLLSTVSTAFEHQYGVQSKLIDSYGAPCNVTLANTPPRTAANDAAGGAHPLAAPPAAATAPPEQQPSTSFGIGAGVGVGSATLQWPTAASRADRGAAGFDTPPAAAGAAGALVVVSNNNNNNSNNNNSNNNTSIEATKPLRVGHGSAQLKANIPIVALAHLPMEHTWDFLLQSQFIDGGSAEARDLPPADAASVGRLQVEMPPLHERFVWQAQMQLLQQPQSSLTAAQASGQPPDDADDDVVGVGVGVGVAEQQLLFGGIGEPVTDFNITFYCENVTYYQNTYSSLAQNTLYTRIWYFFTLFVFVVIPLCVLATFNCVLIMLVRRSKSLRGEMTNASSMRRPAKRKSASSVSQENRVTVTLIAVVLLFIVCQLPWAIYLIVSEHMDIEANLQAIFGNVFNFLAAINAAANFFLYCVLSDKYRKTVRELVTRNRYRSQRSQMAYAHTSLYTHTHHGAHHHNTNTNNNNNNNNNNTTTIATVNGAGGGGAGGSRRYRAPAATSMVIK